MGGADVRTALATAASGGEEAAVVRWRGGGRLAGKCHWDALTRRCVRWGYRGSVSGTGRGSAVFRGRGEGEVIWVTVVINHGAIIEALRWEQFHRNGGASLQGRSCLGGHHHSCAITGVGGVLVLGALGSATMGEGTLRGSVLVGAIIL